MVLARATASAIETHGRCGQVDRPAGTYGRAILNRLLIDLSWASSNLEGNTYTLLDTRQLVERGKAAQGKAAAETQMILNHKAAIELLVAERRSPEALVPAGGGTDPDALRFPRARRRGLGVEPY